MRFQLIKRLISRFYDKIQIEKAINIAKINVHVLMNLG